MFFQSYHKAGNSFILFLFILLSLQSCVPHKDLVTLNGNETLPPDFKSEKLMHTTKALKYEAYKVKPYDQLMIKLNFFRGDTEEFLYKEFSMDNNGNQNMNFDPSTMYFITYVVDRAGYLNLPVVEQVYVEGLTIFEIEKKLEEVYQPHLKYVSSTIKLANNRITVMGEVNSPGVHYLYTEQNSILDAISMAGDFTDFANRRKVKLIRHSKEGLETVYLNMNRSEFMYSPYYYIQPYDVIYVEPSRKKPRDVGANATGVIISGVSVGVLILSLFINK